MTNPPSAYLRDAAAPDDLYAEKPPSDIDRPQPHDVTTAFTSGFRGDSVDPVTVDTTTDPDGPPAWLVALTGI